MLRRLSLVLLFALAAAIGAPAQAAFDQGNLICETTTTTGTSTLNLSESGCDAGDFVTFASQITSGDTTTYTIVASDGTLETGTGVYTAASPDTLTRVPLWSSAGSATALTLPAGTHRVYVQWNTASYQGGLNAFDVLSISVDNLNDVTALNATTESTVEAAIDTLANLTSIQGISLGTITAVGVSILDNADPAAHSIVGFNNTANTYVDKTLGTGITTDADSVDLDTDLVTWSAVTPNSNVSTWIATPSSANLLAAVTDETGSGALVFGTAPDLTISATTETNIEAALDTLANVTSIGGDVTAGGDFTSTDDTFVGDDLSLTSTGALINIGAANDCVITHSADTLTLSGCTAVGFGSPTNYVSTVADGTGIDGTASGAGSTYTPTLDLTEITEGTGIDLLATTISLDFTEITSVTWGSSNFTDMTFSGAGAIDLTWNYATSSTAILTHTDAGAVGPILRLHHNSGSPAAADVIGEIQFNGGTDDEALSSIESVAVDALATGAEDTSLVFKTYASGGEYSALTLNGTDALSVVNAAVFLSGTGGLQTTSAAVGAGGATIILNHDPSDDSEANNDYPGIIYYIGQDSGNAAQIYGQIAVKITDTVAATEDAQIEVCWPVNGASTCRVQFGTSGPNEAGLGVRSDGTAVVFTDNIGTRWLEALTNGSSYREFISPAALTTSAGCTFENDTNFIPDSCVGDGSDASDARLKDVIGPAGDVGGLIDAIRIYDFKWNTDAPEASEDVRYNKRGFGPLAQELINVNADFVEVGGDDPIKDPWTWKPEKVVPYLIVEVQNLRKRVKELEAK